MTIEINRGIIFNIILQILKWIKWPLVIIICAFILSPHFWNYWRTTQPNSELILSYINSLKWPLIILFLFLMTKKYIPSIIDRIEEITFAKLGVKLTKATQTNPENIPNITKGDEPAEDDLSEENKELKQIEKQLATPAAQEFFEFLSRSLYGSQLMILKRLLKKIPNGLDSSELIDLYKAHVRAAKGNGIVPYPSLEHLMQFLIDNSLVIYGEDDDKNYKITYAGLYFLKFLQDNDKFYLQLSN